MFKNIVRMVVGDPIERALAKYRERVQRINAFEPAIEQLDDEQLRAKTTEFKQRLANGETLDDILEEAFAVVREAAKRTIRLRPYDVQLIGGIVLHEGRIAEMKTGEGKTLVATLPLYLNALTGRGVHLVTPNDYLSKYGLQTMGPIYHSLGLTASVIQNSAGNPDDGSFLYDPDYDVDDDRFQGLRAVTRREAYAADITYGTNNEFGFDYLRDNMVLEQTQLSQRAKGLYYAIIDEVDNILIDEARTPLIISGPADQPSDYYKLFAGIVKKLGPSSQNSIDDEEPDGDYVVDIKDRVAYLTEAGVEKVEKLLNVEQLYHPDNGEMIPYMDNCLRAETLYERDKEYIVDNGEIVIVDEFTGRLMHGRRFSEGLHQAIEAKEGVQIRRENLTLATVTFQNFFRMYKKLAGMTGTALTEQEEFEKIYSLEVVAIPTNVDITRIDQNDLIYGTEAAKWKSVIQEIKERHEKGQPVLVGTVAIETSERLSKMLKRANIPHEVLNAKYHEREAGIIAQAGRPEAVTIATNMAGRGVDILLGGNPEGIARETLRKRGIDMTSVDETEWQEALEEAKIQVKENRKHVLDVGGLYVLGTERHDARRIDNQLRGRSGRQGDPGETRFFLSLEDNLVKRFGGDRVKSIMEWANMGEDEPIDNKLITRAITQAQVRVEGHNFDIRKRVLEYDDVVNRQREVIYKQRRDILQASAEDLHARYLRMLETAIGEVIDEFMPVDNPDSWDYEVIYRQMFTVFPIPEEITVETITDRDSDSVEEIFVESATRAYEAKAAEVGDLMPVAERQMLLRALDMYWQRHLTDLDVLREGIGLMAIAQRDPLVEYKRESFMMFNALREQIDRVAIQYIFRVQLQQVQRQPVRRQMQAHRPDVNGATATSKPEPARANKKPGRNDPCWCGSGKKYKHCHYQQDRQAEAASEISG
ncbi:MAG: Preprotein translocase subunit SecA (ATPase, RNA helicase) [Chloroflexi bacterium AL-W]|nr:Preprotein translocase subunit SecA (ATPase, RNA helicase) [Chloroflexi bacterium AL-W]